MRIWMWNALSKMDGITSGASEFFCSTTTEMPDM